MQIVYISNRPDRLIETIAHVNEFMPFITEGIIIGPDSQQAKYGNLESRIEFTFISEEEILGDEYSAFQNLDHQKRNFLLRTEMARHPVIKDEFIMSDDDARPLKSISLQYFKQDERYHSYYYYDLAEWHYGFNEFDVGQQNTCQVLKYYDLPHLSYASHMPQIINRGVFLEMAKELSAISQDYAVCEWSTYFNYAQSKYPEQFHKTQTFQTLCWPDFPTSWPHYVKPEAYCFENFTPSLYETDQPFSGISSRFSIKRQKDNNLEKILRWYQHELKCQNPVSWDDISATPYPIWKKVFIYLLLPVKKITRQVSWQNDARICQIISEIEKIQRSLDKPDIK